MRTSILFILLITLSCSRKDSEKNLNTTLTEMDEYLRAGRIADEEIVKYITVIDSQLAESDRKRYVGGWTTDAYYRYNHDSSITMIKSRKLWADGFRREIILHIGDSALLVKNFDVLTEDQDSSGFEIIETIEYLTATKNLLSLIRHKYPGALKDTLELRTQPYGPLDPGGQLHYFSQLTYARSLMTRN